MKIATILLSLAGIGLIIFNATKLNFDHLLTGDSFIAVITIVLSACAILLLQILRISKKIDHLSKTKRHV